MIGTNLLKEIPAIGPSLYRFVVGGESIAGPALLRFYTWHIFGLALPALLITTWHIFRVRRDGGISHRQPEPRVRREQLVRIELMAALLTLAALLGLSLLSDAPLGPAADPTVIVTAPHAPWFFRWVQELLRAAPSPLLAGVLTPLAVLLLLGLLPYTLDRSDDGVGQWFNRPGRVAQAVFLLVFVVIAGLTVQALWR
jgi:quinol-cytochrome oxidoreductase complex cytochrome b subunit